MSYPTYFVLRICRIDLCRGPPESASRSRRIRSAHARIQDLDHRTERPGRRSHRPGPRGRQRGVGHRPLHRRRGAGEPREGRRSVRDRQPGRRGLHRRSRPTSTTSSTWRWPRAAGGTRTSAANAESAGLLDGPLPRREGLPALLLGGRLRPAGRRAREPSAPPSATTTSLCSQRIPSPRSRGRSSSGRWRARLACRPPSRASTCPTATTAGGRSSTWR